MWEHLQSIAQLLTAVVLALNFIQSYRNGRKIKEVAIATDGMKDELVKVNRADAFAKGVKHGEDHPLPLVTELEAYVKNGDDGLVKVSQKAIEEAIQLLKGKVAPAG